MRWLVTGACGRLGGHVVSELRRGGNEVLATSRQGCARHQGEVLRLDLSRRGDLRCLLEGYRPTHVIHLAAMSSPGACERAPGPAWDLNARVTGCLADYASATGAHLLVASTDFVWLGDKERRYTEEDSPDGLGVYAMSKVAAEHAVLTAEVGAVVRYSAMFGTPTCSRPNFFEHQIHLLRAGQRLRVVADEYRTPLSLIEAARATARISAVRHHGVVHVAGPDVLTPVDQVRAYANALDLGEPDLEFISRSELDARVKRPRNMTMATHVLANQFASVMPEGLTPAGVREACEHWDVERA